MNDVPNPSGSSSPKPDRILVATGGSPHSKLAVAFAHSLASALTSPITLLCVADDQPEDCDSVFGATLPMLGDLEVETEARVGHAPEQILQASDEGDFWMIVMGEKGHHTPLTRFLIGPTAERVASRARIPVLVVKGSPDAPVRPIRRILLAMAMRERFSDVDRILDRVVDIAAPLGAKVTILHVMSQMPIPPAGTPEDWEANAAELIDLATAEGQFLGYVLTRLADAGIEVDALVKHGLVVDEILKESETGEYDLLTIGGHEPGNWLSNLVLENVALQIVHRSRLSVLTVHG